MNRVRVDNQCGRAVSFDANSLNFLSFEGFDPLSGTFQVMERQMFRLSFSRTGLLIGIVLLQGLFCSEATAQKNSSGKDIARELLRGLIESQMEQQERESFGPNRPRQPGSAPLNQATPEMQQLRRLLMTLSQESAALAAVVSADARRNPELRLLQPDILRFQATATATQQRADRENNHLSLQLSIQSLDQAWKPLAYQLERSRGLTPQARDLAGRISRLDGQICQILGITEQFNSRDLVRAADLLAADLNTLTDDISYVAATSSNRQRLIPRLRRLQEQASLFANLAASRPAFVTVVTEYRSLYQTWQALRPDIDQYSGRSLARTVARIQETHRSIHQMLRLEFGLDLALIQKMSESLERDLTELSRNITLEQIMLLPDSRSLPSSADALFGMAQNLTDLVTRREPIEAIGEAWMYLDQQWSLMEFYLQPIAAQDTLRRMQGISQEISALKDALGVVVAFDRSAIQRQATALTGISESLHDTIHRWVSRPGQKVAGLVEKSHQVEDRCSELSSLANSRADRTALLAKSQQVLVAWQQLRPDLNTCETDERATLDQIADEFIQIMIQLQTMLEE
jgi:hypothetical protein